MQEKRKRRVNWLLVAAIFVVVTAVSFVNPADTVTAFVEDGHLVLEGYNEVQYFISMDTIEQVTFVENPEYAVDERGVVCDTYTNDTWGEHILYANTKIDVCIAVESVSGIYVFNVENEATTKAFYEAFLEIL